MLRIKFSEEGVKRKLKNYFTKNISIKIVALVFAIILWGYVLSDTDPYRVKNISNVTLSFDGEAELLAKGYCVRTKRSELLKSVDVAVRTRITNYNDLSGNSVNATVSLKNINRAQEYKLPVLASVTSALGVVEQVYPSNVTIEIDSLVNKTIPVTCTFIGELPEGYWADMDALTSTSRLDIQGAKTDVAKISRAECVIDLTDRTKSVIGTFDVVLYNSDNEPVDNDVLIGSLPSSTVYLPIYGIRTVPVDITNSVLGADTLAANYELVSAVVTPQTVRIVGDPATIDGYPSIAAEPFSISGLSESAVIETELIVPPNIRVLEGTRVDVSLDIRETILHQEFVQIPVSVTGLTKKMEAAVKPEAVDISIEGRTSLVTLIKRGNVKAEVDVTGLTEGTYELPVSVYVKDDNSTIELNLEVSEKVAKIVLTAKE